MVALLVVAANPFRSVPTVKVVSASWSLTSAGYVLNLVVETTDKVQLVAVDVGGRYYSVAYDVFPPVTNLSIPLPVDSPQGQLTLHFDILSPISVHTMTRKEVLRVDVAAGRSKLLLYGTVPSRSIIVVTQVPEDMSTAVLVNWRRYLVYLNILREVVPGANVTVISVPSEEAVDALKRFGTLVFVEVAPEPSLLYDLLRMGKNIVLHTYDYALGEYRIKLVNNTLVEMRMESDNPEIDYMDIPCIRKQFTIDTVVEVDFLNKLRGWLGQVDGSYAVAEPMTYMLFSETYVKDKYGYVYLGKTRKGFYYSSIGIKHLAVLLASGFFETKGKVTYSFFELQPFSGFRVVDVPVVSSRVLVYAEGFGAVQRVVVPPPVVATERGDRVTISIGIDKYGRTVWNGTASIKVMEVTYDGRLLDIVVDSSVSLPTMLDLPASSHTAYVVYVNNRLVYAVADELTERPYIMISNSEVCEMFYLEVSRKDNYNSPLYLYINGKRVAVLYPGQTYTTTTCVPGYYSVEVRNVYGVVVISKVFKVSRFYEQPLFILSSLLMGSVIVTGYLYTRKRSVKEVDYVTLILYRLPEKKGSEVSLDSITEEVHKIHVRRKILPTVKEVVEHIYRRRPMMRVVVEFFRILRQAVEGNKLVLYSRYLPELDDTISVVGYGKHSTVVPEFYSYVVLEMMKKFGGSMVPREYLKDVIDVDIALLLGENLLLLNYVTGARMSVDEEIRSAIDRAFTGFMMIRRLKLPFKPIGFAIVTESKYIRLVNRYIDEILGGNRDLAAKLLKDMSVFQRITEASRDAWIKRYILVAVPLTRLVPLMAFAKVGAPKLCNHYYRYAPLY
ncbi:MAG: hypothetical protein QXJ97_00335 [Desulfurococcaceae archaeon]